MILKAFCLAILNFIKFIGKILLSIMKVLYRCMMQFFFVCAAWYGIYIILEKKEQLNNNFLFGFIIIAAFAAMEYADNKISNKEE